MKRSDFYVGQRIIYTDSGYAEEGIKATVVEIKDRSIIFLWNTKSLGPHRKISLSMQATFDKMVPEEIIPIEEQVSRRIKKLWNESNYVKNNPRLVY